MPTRCAATTRPGVHGTFTAILEAARESGSNLTISKGAKAATGTHGGRAKSHIEILSPDRAAAIMHRRLHVSYARLK